MAVRRRIGDFAQMLLQDHLIRKRQQEGDERDLVRAREMAEINSDNSILSRALGDPKVAERLHRAGARPAGVDLSALGRSNEEALGEISTGIAGSKEREQIPTDDDIMGQVRGLDRGLEDPVLRQTARFEGDEQTLPSTQFGPRRQKPIEELLAQRDAKRGAFDLADQFEVDKAGATSFSQTLGAGRGKETVDAESFPAQLGRKKDEFSAMTPLEVSRDVQSATAQARALLPIKLKEAEQEAMVALANKGNMIQAEEVGKRNAAIRGLLPTYTMYRELAVEVSQIMKNNPEWLKSGIDTVGKLPWVGEFLASGAESFDAFAMAQVEQGGTLDFLSDIPAGMAQKLNQLNRLTDTLAQGMANAVLGNRGQTTENDRRTAKNILVNSLTSAQSATDLLGITDRMFTMLPTTVGEVVTQDPFATPEDIILRHWERVNAAPIGEPPDPSAGFGGQTAPSGPNDPATRLRNLRGR